MGPASGMQMVTGTPDRVDAFGRSRPNTWLHRAGDTAGSRGARVC
jgi:hypothetical protein